MKKRGKGVRHCKKCGEAGHRKDTCPNGKPKKDANLRDGRKSLKLEGWSLERVSSELDIPLKIVNEYW